MPAPTLASKNAGCAGQICATGPADVLARIEAAEQSDPDGKRWARSKPSDDTTLAVMRFT